APAGKSVALALGNAVEVVRYNPGGTVDTSFGVDGRFTLNFSAEAIAVERDGSVLVAGANTLLPLTSVGNTDDSFGAGGFVTLASDGTIISGASDIRELPNGSIVLLRRGTTDGTTPAASVTHLFSNGNIDTTFVGDGTSSFALPLTVAGVSFL